MNKQKVFTILYVILIITLILFMIWIVIFLKGNATDCMNDPIEYIEERIGGASCYCMKNGEVIMFNKGTGSYINNNGLE